MINQLNKTISAQTELIQSLQKTLEADRLEKENLRQQIEYLTKKLFGTSSEKRKDIDGQLNLFDEAEQEADLTWKQELPDDITVPEHKRKSMAHGVCEDIAQSVPVENGLSLSSRSVMGAEIPLVSLEAQPVELSYGFMDTSALVDEAYIKFDRVKKLTAELAEVENSVYRLATAVNKTQKRANALKNIILPRLTSTVKYITDSLEEKEREDFSRLKVIKTQKNASRKENT